MLELKNWLDKLMEYKIPKKVIALNFNLYECASNYWLIELIGSNVFDEYDEEELDIKKIDENTYIVNGMITSYELKKIFDVELPEGDYETLSGYLLDKLGRIPEEDEHPVIEDENLTYRVEEIEDRRIKYVKVCRNMEEQVNDESN